MAAPAEAEVLALCARAHLDPAAREHLRTCLERTVDWTVLVQLAVANSVGPLLSWNLMQIEGSVPAPVLSLLREYFDRVAVLNGRLTNELRSLLRTMRDADIAAIPFKGPWLAWSAYCDVRLRRFTDLDILVQPSDLGRLHWVLEARGYRSLTVLSRGQWAAYRRYHCEDAYVHPDRKIVIEPHWNLATRNFRCGFDYTDLWSRAMPRSWDGSEILDLAPEDTLICLCFHGSKHEWLRLQWICDVAEWLRQHRELDWDVVLERASRQRCRRMVLLGAWLAATRLGAPVPARVLAAVRRDATIEGLADTAWHRALNGWNTAGSMLSVSGYRAQLPDRRRDRLRYVVLTVTQPGERHIRLADLPGSVSGFYVVLRLVHDYLLLPVWLLAKALSRWWRRRLSR